MSTVSPYVVLQDIFHQSSGDGVQFPSHPLSFGLKDHTSANRWQPVCTLLASDPQIKLLIIGRHGQGVHNLGQLKYGPEKWTR